MPRIYLDNAATSWPKPSAVYDAVDRYQRDVGAAAGRGAYDSAAAATRTVSTARKAVAGLIGAADPSRVVFTASGTEALNLAIFGIVGRGQHVVTTVCEHNSVLRPLALLRDAQEVSIDYVPCDASGVVDPADVAAAMRSSTSLVALTSASNVTGTLQPVADVGRLCHERGVPLLVDAAQSLGHEPIDVAADGISLLAAPGHKALLGPLGTGLLYVSPELGSRLAPLHYGGTGLNSDEELLPDRVPERYEAGNLNVPALAGLAAGAEAAASGPGDALRALTQRLKSELDAIAAVTRYGPAAEVVSAPVVSFNVDGYDPQEVAAVMASAGIECRAGLHCAPRMHQALGTAERGGAVRLSPGVFSTVSEIETTVELLRQLSMT